MNRLSSLVLSSVAAIACIGAVGCSAEAVDAGEPIESATQDLGSAIDVPNPSGAYFARISANGTGCPAGTWDAQISEDGKAFTVSFNAYEAIVEPGKAFSIKDCTLAIDLKTPGGFSFSVSSFYYQGYAILDSDGMNASQTAKYYFRGNPVPGVEYRTDMTGPYEESYLFANDVGIADQVWSPCGASRTLNVQTRLVVRNNRAKTGWGYFNATTADGTIETPINFRFGLAWRRC